MAQKTSETTNLKLTKYPSKPKGNQWPGAFATYWRTFQQVRRNAAPALLFIGLYVAFTLFSSLLQGGKGYATPGYRNYEALLQLALVLALPTYGLALSDKRHISVSEVLEINWRKYVFMLLASIIYVAVLLVSFLLLIVPIIWAVGWFTLYQFPIIEDDADPAAALQESRRISKDEIGKIWAVIGAGVVWSIPGVFITSLVPYVLAPAYLMFISVLTYGVLASLYRQLQGVSEEA